MAAAAAIIPTALALASVLSNVSSASKQRKQQNKQEKINKQTDRRAAIERALNSGFQVRGGRDIGAADISNQQILGGISQLGSQIGFSPQGQKLLGAK